MAVEILLTDVENEKPETLRRISNVLLMLAGDVAVSSGRTNVGTVTVNVPGAGDTVADQIAESLKDVKWDTASLSVGYTVEEELPAEFEGNDGVYGPIVGKSDVDLATVPPVLSAAQAFAQNTVDVNPSQTVPVDTTATTLTEAASAPPPPAPPAPGQVAQTDTAANPTDSVPSGETDVNGVRWDERIHSRNKTKISDGTWKLMRGVSPTLVSQVIAEQRGQPVVYATEAGAAMALPEHLKNAEVFTDSKTAPPPPVSVASAPASVSTTTDTAATTAAAPAAAPPPPNLNASSAVAGDSETPSAAPVAANQTTIQTATDKPITWLGTVTRSTNGVKNKQITQEDFGLILKEKFNTSSVSSLNGADNFQKLVELNAILDTLGVS